MDPETGKLCGPQHHGEICSKNEVFNVYRQKIEIGGPQFLEDLDLIFQMPRHFYFKTSKVFTQKFIALYSFFSLGVLK